MYGELAFEKEPDWHYKMQDVTLDILLKTGRFAMIYKASLYKHGKPMECVAKTLRGKSAIFIIVFFFRFNYTQP